MTTVQCILERENRRMHVAILVLSCVVLLLALWVAVLANMKRPVSIVPHTCEQSAYNNGPNYRYRAIRYRWRHV